MRTRRGFVWKSVVVALGVVAAIGTAVALANPRINTTRNDFYFRGSQPVDVNVGNFDPLMEAGNCSFCHGNLGDDEFYPEASAPYERWRFSMMAQAYRDPVFHAMLYIAEKDATGASDACLRCHAPAGWLQGRATASDGSSLFPSDTDGVSCSICHRSVDPDNKPGAPAEDLVLLQALGANRPLATGPGVTERASAHGHIVIDPQDRRRGPFNLGPQFSYHQWLQSQWHRESGVCITCHDVSNPVYSKEQDGSYVPNTLNAPHPTGNKYDMFPLDRLGSEWILSAFGAGPVTQVIPDGNGGFTGRFGGNGQTSYSSCQDCHMPDLTGTGCNPGLGSPVRPDFPRHEFQGGNTWVLRAVGDLFNPLDSQLSVGGEFEPQLDQVNVDAAIERNREMLRRASDLQVSMVGGRLRTRIINESGHKLPGGFSEGKRMWLNVRFFGPGDTLVAESGAYNPATADLDTASTKIYEAKSGLDAVAAMVTGLPVGPSFHLDLNNKVFFDNRIPPRGFTNASYQLVQAAPVGVTYADGQHWDDTLFAVPAGAVRAEVRVLYQTSTKPFMEFLRDNADKPVTPESYIQPPAGSTATTLGQIVHEQWVKWGRSTPVEMDMANLPTSTCRADFGGQGQTLGADGLLGADDIIVFINLFFANDPLADLASPGQVPQSDNKWTADDIIVYINYFFQGCGS
jgi:hypothetical protein